MTAAAPEGRSRESHLSSRLSRESTRAADCVGGVDLGYHPNDPVAVHFLAHSHHLQGRKEREDKRRNQISKKLSIFSRVVLVPGGIGPFFYFSKLWHQIIVGVPRAQGFVIYVNKVVAGFT